MSSSSVEKKPVEIVAHIHPFAPSERVRRSVEPGQTVAEIVAETVPHRVGRTLAIVNGAEIAPESWDTLRPAEGSLVVVRVVPGGNPTDTEKAVGAVLFIAGAVLAPFTGGTSLLLSGLGTIIGTGAIPAMANAVGGVVKDIYKGKNGVTESQLVSISGGQNPQISYGAKIPFILGKHRVTPYALRPWTEIGGTDGADVYLRQLFVVGYSPVKLTQLKVGENLIATNAAATRNGAITVDGIVGASELEIQVYDNGTNPTLYPSYVLEERPGIELKAGEESWQTTPPAITRAIIDIEFPRGLYGYTDDGTKVTKNCQVEIRRRAAGSGLPYGSAAVVGTFNVTKAESKTLRYSATDNVASGQYEYCAKRLTADDPDNFKGSSQVYWSAMRSIRHLVPAISADVRSRYTIVAMKVKASKTFQGVIDRFNCIAEAEVNVYDGSGSGAAEWAGTGFSRNPAAAYLRALRGPMNRNPVPNALIDWPRLESWHNLCATKGWYCDGILAQGERLQDSLNRIASAGRAALMIRDGLYSVVVDEPKTTPINVFTPWNIRDFTWTKAFQDQPHALRVGLISASEGYQADEIVVLNDGYLYDTDGDGQLEDWQGTHRLVGDPIAGGGTYQLATRFQRYDPWGKVDAAEVTKHARWRMAVAKLRPEFYTFTTNAQGLTAEPGDLVRVAHYAIAVGLGGGRITARTLDGSNNVTSVTLDEIVEMEAGNDYALRIRRASDNGQVAAQVVTVAGETQTLTFSTPISAASAPAVGDFVAFGELGIETLSCLVTGVEPEGSYDVRVTVADEAPGVHTADVGAMATYNPRISLPAAPSAEGIVQRFVETTQEARDAEQFYAAPPASKIEVVSPKYLGAFTADPVNAVRGDVYYRKNTTPKKIRRYSGSAWADVATSDPLFSQYVGWALNDILAENLAAGDDGITVITNLVAKNLFAYAIKVLTGGSIRGGDRYNADGTLADGTKPGFYIAASGACKVAGIEFEGSGGGGVQWGVPTLTGTSYSLTSPGIMSMASMSANTIALVRGGSGPNNLQMFYFNGSTWSTLGSGYFILGMNGTTSSSISALDSTNVAIYDGATGFLRTVRFNGTSWALVGNTLAISVRSQCAISQNSIALVELSTSELRTYSFNGTSWTQVGTGLAIGSPAFGLSSITALNSTDVAVFGDTPDELRTYRFNGSAWSRIGNSLSIPSAVQPAIAALNGTDIVYTDGQNDRLSIYRFNGQDWTRVGSAGATGLGPTSGPCMSALGGSEIAMADNSSSSLRIYRFSFATSIPYARTLTGF